MGRLSTSLLSGFLGSRVGMSRVCWSSLQPVLSHTCSGMKILFDQGTPLPLRAFLEELEIHTLFEKGWHRLTKGDVIAAAVLNDYDVLISTD
jgi:hypothetical protein